MIDAALFSCLTDVALFSCLTETALFSCLTDFALFSCLTDAALFSCLTDAELFSRLTNGIGVCDFLAVDYAALVLRLAETDFAADAFLDLASLADLAETGFLLDALFLEALFTTSTVISGASVLIFSVFFVLIYTGFFLVRTVHSESSMLIAWRRFLASAASFYIASLGFAVFSNSAISSKVMTSGLAVLFKNG